MKRLLILLAALALCGCTPLLVQQPMTPGAAFAGPRLEDDWVVSFDGARLGLKHWEPADGQPWAVIVGLHGMNDYSNAFHLAAPWWAEHGIATYAYDQRGFGRSPGRGVWAGDELMIQDLRTVTALVRQKYPEAIVAVAGESMGGAVAAEAFASSDPPAADRLILLAPAVWGWQEQPLPNKTLLWFAANFTPGKVYEPPRWLTSRITPTDNRAELIAMGHDPLMIWGARSDALYGLVSMMQRGFEAVGRAAVPTLYLHGDHDQIIPKAAALDAAAHLKPTDRSADYARGYHLLLRDKQAKNVWADVAAFIRAPEAPLPSGAPPIPGSPALGPSQRAAAGL
jgi:alpha-beta hydrolase superfamily lysophospholipase